MVLSIQMCLERGAFVTLSVGKSEIDRHDNDAGEGFLGRDAWIGAGVTLLIADGIEQVKITKLADRLGVTRGSFYWHFKDRDDLLNALLAHWRGRNTEAIVGAVSDRKTVTDGIMSLFQVWTDHDVFDPVLDAAVRSWGHRDPAVKKAVQHADTTRIAALHEMYKRDGYIDPDAFIRARVLYFSQVGYFALETARHETLDERRSYIEAYFQAFTGRELDPEIAADHKARVRFKERF